MYGCRGPIYHLHVLEDKEKKRKESSHGEKTRGEKEDEEKTATGEQNPDEQKRPQP